ncbi:hypothetical protein PG994_009850 [Apiospora phragmitis]|uniref:Uncharacterized protein n=1 Tax=Apiospora phragmitis TaxID=2905665 RepID=A0ABR1TN83_9PEZI
MLAPPDAEGYDSETGAVTFLPKTMPGVPVAKGRTVVRAPVMPCQPRPARADGKHAPVAVRQHIARGDGDGRPTGETVGPARAGREDARAVGGERHISERAGAQGDGGIAGHGRAPVGGGCTPTAGAE